MNRVLKATLSGAAVLAIVAAVGCGSSESSSTATEATTAGAKGRKWKKLHWEWHASLVCKKGMEQADVLMHKASGKPAPKPPSASPDWESFQVPVKVLLPTFRQTWSELEAIEPDTEDAYDYERILERMRIELKEAEREPDAPISSRPLKGAGKTAYVYGIHACLF
ncbi:MAG TPA: hypothetical protein VFJ76_06475 [Solirubrobacterales bacterium]|nr:hypothetical protein [Solirubrobacterales bacterium]